MEIPHTTINIKSKEQSSWENIGLEWKKDALCSRFQSRLGAYSNPNGDDCNKLDVKIKEGSATGCELKDNAFRFTYIFNEQKAVLQIDKSCISMLAQKASVSLVLSGKYNFTREVEITFNHRPMIGECVLKAKEKKYFPNPEKEDSIIAELIICSDAFTDGKSIETKVEKKSSCDGYIDFDEGNITIEAKKPFRINIRAKKEKFIHGLDKIHKCAISVGGKDYYLELLPSTCKSTDLKENQVIVELKQNVKYDKEKQQITVYKDCPPILKENKISTESFDAENISITGNGVEIVEPKPQKIDKGKSFCLKYKVYPDENPRREASIIVKSDYSKDAKCDITIKTDEPNDPEPKLTFKLTDKDKVVYYLDQGELQIGTLIVDCQKPNNLNTKDDVSFRKLKIQANDIKYSPFDQFITIKPQNQIPEDGLALGESIAFDVFFDAKEKEWNLNTGDKDIQFELDGKTSIKKQITIKKKTLEDLEDIEFDPNNITYNKEQEFVKAGTLTITYKKSSDSIKYIQRQNGVFSFDEKDYLSFSNSALEQKLEEGKKEYPIFLNLKAYLDGKENDNYTYETNIRYKDDHEKKLIPISVTITHDPAIPELRISYRGKDETEYVDLTDKSTTIEIEAKRHEFESQIRNDAHRRTCFKLQFENLQKIPYKDNRLAISSLSLEGSDYIKEAQKLENFEIRNGGEPVSLELKMDYTKVPLKLPEHAVLQLKFTLDIVNDSKNTPNQKELKIILPLKEKITDGWYSIDLGTSGIVVAKWDAKANIITPIKFDTGENEEGKEIQTEILSSCIVLKKVRIKGEDKEQCEMIVSPTEMDIMQNKYQLPPCKFLIGQDHIPMVKKYEKEFPNGVVIGKSKPRPWREIKPNEIVEYTYKTIFEKINVEERKNVRKLILTYPNTYTPLLLERLQKVILESKLFPSLSAENLHFIPESDAVVAYYVNKKINSDGFGDILDGGTKTIVIYDMGAGTLDLSLVDITHDAQEGIKVIFKKRIGIPIAGEYFTYLLFKQQKENWEKINKGLKVFIDRRKCEWKEDDDNLKIQNDDDENFLKTDYKDNEFNNKGEISAWINICTNDILNLLLGGKNPDQIIYSGRGSQFQPIRKEISSNYNGKIDDKSISINELKTCVALGAIMYQQIFQNINRPFQIVHHNSIMNMGIEYSVLDNFKKTKMYKQVLGEEDLILSSNKIGGAFFSSFKPKDLEFDFSENGDVKFYLTHLPEDKMKEIINKREDKQWCFVSYLFSFNTMILGSENPKRKNTKLHIESNADNQLFLTLKEINDEEEDIDLNEQATIENIENNQYFQDCNWYLIENENNQTTE